MECHGIDSGFDHQKAWDVCEEHRATTAVAVSEIEKKCGLYGIIWDYMEFQWNFNRKFIKKMLGFHWFHDPHISTSVVWNMFSIFH